MSGWLRRSVNVKGAGGKFASLTSGVAPRQTVNVERRKKSTRLVGQQTERGRAGGEEGLTVSLSQACGPLSRTPPLPLTSASPSEQCAYGFTVCQLYPLIIWGSLMTTDDDFMSVRSLVPDSHTSRLFVCDKLHLILTALCPWGDSCRTFTLGSKTTFLCDKISSHICEDRTVWRVVSKFMNESTWFFSLSFIGLI